MAAHYAARAALLTILLLMLARAVIPQAVQDSRCYLKNGGAVESFFVSEDTPVGSVIGTLSVNGDPSPGGDISLRLQERDAAVGVSPGSLNITLLKPLDREERTGPASVYVNVRCDRLPATDPSFIIPVSLRVWDVNDNAPIWIGGPYKVRVSELAAVGARLPVNARATDADQAGPHATVHYTVLPSPHAEYISFANELDSVLIIKKPLDFESLRNFTLTLRAQDQGNPPLHSDTSLYVEVLDADDQNPKFSSENYAAILPDDAEEGTILITTPDPITARDQDIGINAPVQYSVTGDNSMLLHIDKDTGRVAATRGLLGIREPAITFVLKATQIDNPDRYALATLTIRRGITSIALPPKFSRKLYTASVREDTAPGTVLLKLTTEPQVTMPLQFYVSERSFLEKFAINSAGEVLLRRSLDYEAHNKYDYQVMLTDGNTNDTASVSISVLDVNEWEPRFRYPQYEFHTNDDNHAELVPLGMLEAFDGDENDNVTITLRGTHASLLYVNESGGIFLKKSALPSLNASFIHVVATATDSGDPPRQSSVPVSVWVSRESVSSSMTLAASAAAVATLLFALLLFLLLRRRRSKSSPSPSPSASIPPAVDKPPPPQSTAPVDPRGSTNSLLSVSAGASTILSSSSLDLRNDTLPKNASPPARQSIRHHKTKVAPSPPGAHTHGATSHNATSHGATSHSATSHGATSHSATSHGATSHGAPVHMSDHLVTAGSRSGVAWPSGTIPARVKTLSWDTQTQGSANPESLHDATNSTLHDNMNLTVYF